VDRRTLIAVGVCLALLLLYQPLLRTLGLGAYLDRGRPTPTATVPAADSVSTAPRPAATANAAHAELPAAPHGRRGPSGSPGSRTSLSSGAVAAPPEIERDYDIETPLYQAHFTNRGARLLAVELKEYASALGARAFAQRSPHARRGQPLPPGERVVLAGGPLFALDLSSGSSLHSLADLTYTVAESADAAGETRTLTFRARDSAGVEIRQIWRARPQDYALDLSVEIRDAAGALKAPDYSLTLRSWPLVTERNLQADERSLRASSMLGQDVHKDHPSSLRNPKVYEGNAAWAGVQNRYFLAAAAVVDGPARGVLERSEQRVLSSDQLELLPAGTKNVQDVAINSLRMALPGETRPVQRFLMYFGPVEYPRLDALHAHLERAVDLGWTWLLPFSRALLQLMNWLYRLVPNYGLAIALLATLVRVVLHPLNMSSMKSQRALMKIQPEMERLRAKHKNDPQALNTAVMGLYRENKVNPAGGCLPMVVQMPLFFALYSVLFNAIELRQAPFFGWINDLSAPDLVASVAIFPIRLLPLLMTASGFLTQMLTPTDPKQKPTMYMMNVFMLVFFYNLPSGLVLYWTVMNLLTAAQQWLVMRQDGAPEPAVLEVVSPRAARQGSKR
jgi:YidC/Oxa1 family membrane protein insertase